MFGIALVSVGEVDEGKARPPMDPPFLSQLLVSLSLALPFLPSSGLVVSLLILRGVAPSPFCVFLASLSICSRFFFFYRALSTLVAGERPLFLLLVLPWAPLPLTLAQTATGPFGPDHPSPQTRWHCGDSHFWQHFEMACD